MRSSSNSATTRKDSIKPRVIPIFNDEKELTGSIIILEDVTLLMQNDEIKKDLFSTISHQLKTPLTSIRMALHLLLEENVGSLNEKQADLLVSARDESERLNGIIEDLLDIRRLESGKVSVEPGQGFAVHAGGGSERSFLPPGPGQGDPPRSRSARRPARRKRRPFPHPVRFRQSAFQCHQVLPGRQRGAADGKNGGRQGPVFGRGRRPRHSQEIPKKDLRQVFPRAGSGCRRRRGLGTEHRQGDRHGAPRPDLFLQHGRARNHVHFQPGCRDVPAKGDS